MTTAQTTLRDEAARREALFQGRDLELLGLSKPDRETEHLKALEEFWATREIAGVGLIDMKAWRWLYENPNATPAQFREAVVRIAQEVWNRYYAEHLGARDERVADRRQQVRRQARVQRALANVQDPNRRRPRASRRPS